MTTADERELFNPEHTENSLETASSEGQNGRSDYEIPRDLSAFRRDLLCVLARRNEPMVGLRIAEALEEFLRRSINDGQLYPNLDKLDEMGLIDKQAKNKRTNEYQITRRGLWVMREYRRFIEDSIPDK